jgi:hypothetical protein
MTDALIQKCIDVMLLEKNRERDRIIEKLKKDYGDKFSTEGLSDYERRMEELDNIFDDRMEKVAKKDDE